MNKQIKLAAAASLAALVGMPMDMASAAVDELVVSARKRDESIQDVPLSVTAFDARMIEIANIVGVEEIAQLTPGFEMYRSYNRAFERPIIRGKSIIFTGTSPTVSFFVNGAYYAGTATSLDLSEAERIEVIKGPQSALFGRSTYSGAINIITKLPGDEFTGKASASAATQGQYEFTGSLAGPIVKDVLSAGFYARYYELDNEFRSTIDERKLGQEQNWSVAGTAVLTPTDTLEVVIRGIYDERDDGAPALGMQEFRFNNYAERTGTPPVGIPPCTLVAGHEANYENAAGSVSAICGFDYFKGTLREVPLTVNYAVGDLYAEAGEEADHRGVMFDTNWEASDSVNLVAHLSYDMFRRHQFKSGEDGLPNGGARLGGAAVPGADDLSDYTIGATCCGANQSYSKATFAVVNNHERTQSVSLDLRAEFDDGGPLRALAGFYHYNEEVKGYEPRINFQRLADNMSAEQAANLTNAFQNAINLEAAILCMQEPGCDPTKGNAQFGAAINTPQELVYDANGPFNDPGQNLIERTTNWAFYGRLEYDITSQLTAGFEARYAEDTKTTYHYLDNANPDLHGGASNFRETFPFFAPRMTLNWDVTDSNMLYFVAARGNKPGGFNTGSSTTENQAIIDAGLQSFDEEKAWSFEFGSKNAFFDQQLVVNVAGYYDDIKGYQLTSAIADDGGNVQSVTVNQGSVKIPGVELELAFAPQAIEGLTMNLGYAYSNGQFKSDAFDRTEGQLNDVLDDGLRNCSQGFLEGTSPPCSSTGTQAALGSIEGRRLPQTAKHMLNGAINYQAPLFGDFDWFTRVDANYTGDRYVQVQNLARIPPATVVNAQIGIQNENFRLALWGKNIFNEDAPVGASRLVSNDSSSRRTFLIFPRRGDQWGATLTARF